MSEMLTPFRGRAGEMLDLTALTLAILVVGSLTMAAELPGRRYVALGFFCFAPGWVLLRRLGAAAGSFLVVAACALSISFTMLAGQILVATGWSWRPATLVLAILAAAAAIWTQRSAPEWTPGPRGPLSDDERLLTLILFGGTLWAVIGIAGADVSRVDDTGLFDALPSTYFVGALILVAGLYVTILRAPARMPRIAGAYLAVLLVILHGLPGILQHHPRFPVAWLHAGFTDVIADSGDLLANTDARFSWASFFTGAALVEKVGGEDGALWMVRFAPVVFNALAAAAVYQLGRAVRLSEKQRWGAVSLFVLVNWVGQDYFAPQAVAFFLSTVLLAAVLGFFTGANLSPRSVWSRVLRPARPSEVVLSSLPVRLLAYAGVLVVVAAIITGHQLTPVSLTLVLLGLAITQETRLRTLALVVGVGTVCWLSFAAEDFWLGHLDRITGSAGAVGGVVEENVGQRSGGGTAGRELLVQTRLGIGALLWLLSLLAMFMAWRARRTPLALACMFFGPFSVALLQSYGGEVLLRVQLYTLPASVLLIASLVLRERMSWWRVALPIPFLVALVPGFLLARYGNEQYEQVTDDDRAVLDALYDVVPDGSTVFIANTQVPHYSERVDEVKFSNMATEDLQEMERIITPEPVGSTYILLTDSQAAYATAVRGEPPEWLRTIGGGLVASGDFEVVAAVGDTVLLERVR